MTSVPQIIQGGMGVAVSHWGLAQTVSRLGQLGVVSDTALDQILARRLQDGDPGGHMRRALASFPYPRIAQRILDTCFVPGGKGRGTPYRLFGIHSIESTRWLQELCIAGNFVEIFLAREGHSNPVGINYLEKIQLPHLPSIYGAMLAGVAVIIVGAGIPMEMPAVLDALASHQPASYPVRIIGAPSGAAFRTTFDPADFESEAVAGRPDIPRPDFLPIVSSDGLASIMVRRTRGKIAGFIVEGNRAGGHNAPPRGPLQLTPEGEPIYGPRDTVDMAAMRALGLPFWMAGSYGSAERLREALSEGAAGVQVGTAFALCTDSGLAPEVRKALVRKALAGEARVFTDPCASPTGFPFKVACLAETLSEADVYQRRHRLCDLGFLREPYLRENGTVGYRCPAEPPSSYLAKGGKVEDLADRKCLCNALVANVGMPQRLGNGTDEPCLVTMGDDATDVHRFCTVEQPDFSAADVIRVLLGG